MSDKTGADDLTVSRLDTFVEITVRNQATLLTIDEAEEHIQQVRAEIAAARVQLTVNVLRAAYR